jgi:phosphatidylserine synthase
VYVQRATILTSKCTRYNACYGMIAIIKAMEAQRFKSQCLSLYPAFFYYPKLALFS